MGEVGKRTGIVHVVDVELRLVEAEVYLDTYQALRLAMKRDLGIALADSHDENQQACNSPSYSFHRFFDTFSIYLKCLFLVHLSLQDALLLTHIRVLRMRARS